MLSLREIVICGSISEGNLLGVSYLHISESFKEALTTLKST